MIDQLKRMALFATVVDSGSLAAAGRRLGQSTSSVSQQLRELEAALGVTLLLRSTRKLRLTEAGARFVGGCRALLDAAEQAGRELEQLRDAPQGELRVASPVGFARHLGPALAPLMAAHPGLSLHLNVDDGLIDLIEARIDLALRFGRLPDSNWVAERLATQPMAICAAPAYLARRGLPSAPQELAAHDWLLIDPLPRAGLLPLAGPKPGQRCELRLAGAAVRARSNNQLSLQQLCEAGLGLALLGRWDAAAALDSGALVALLPQWRPPDYPVYACVPQRTAQPAKVRAALAALRRYLGALAPSPATASGSSPA